MKTCSVCGVQLAWVMGPNQCDLCRVRDGQPDTRRAAENLVRELSAQALETGRWTERARVVRGVGKLTRYHHPRGAVVLITDLIGLIESGMTVAPSPSAPEHAEDPETA